MFKNDLNRESTSKRNRSKEKPSLNAKNYKKKRNLITNSSNIRSARKSGGKIILRIKIY